MKQHYNMYISKFTIFLSISISVLFSVELYSQENDLSIKAEELIYSNPDEAIKIAKHILNNPQQPEAKAKLNLILGKSYLVKGDYNQAALRIFDDENHLSEVDNPTQAKGYLIKATLLRILYLDKQWQNYLFKAQELVSKLPKNTTQDSLQCQVLLENIYMKLSRRENQDALNELNKASIRFKQFLEIHPIENRSIYLAKEIVFSNMSMFDSAYVYLEKAKSLIDSTQNNLYVKALIYRELGHLNLQKKDFDKSEESLFIALKYAELIDNPNLLKEINSDIAINYLATNQRNKHKVYNDEFFVLKNAVEAMEEKSVNTTYNLISQEQEASVTNQTDTYTTYLNLLLVAILIILTIGVFVLLKSEGRKKRLKEIIKYLEISRSNLIRSQPITKTNQKRIVIPEETEQAILTKLKRFENSQKFLNKDMSLAVLAGFLDTNTKYLSEIINSHYQDNFNTYINKLRIEFIINQLKNKPNYINYKISFLAEEIGFSSHSSFTTVFKSIVGMSPATFIDLLKSEREIEKIHDL